MKNEKTSDVHNKLIFNNIYDKSLEENIYVNFLIFDFIFCYNISILQTNRKTDILKDANTQREKEREKRGKMFYSLRVFQLLDDYLFCTIDF